MQNPNDVFHIIPFSRQDILDGLGHQLTDLSLKNLTAMGALHAKFGALVLAERSGLVVRRLCEVYFINPYNTDSVDEFGKKYGINDAQSIYLFNETALALCAANKLKLPAAKGSITRKELDAMPGGVGTMLRWDTFLTP